MAKVKSIAKMQYKGPVYDLHVEGSHTYNISGLAVHNSVGGCLVSYLIGIHDMDPLKWKLSFDRFLSQSRGGNMLVCKME